MIRINLLPVRAARKKESVRFQITVAGLITLFVFLVSIAFYFTTRSEANMIREDIKSSQDELRVLRRKIGELSKIKEQKRVVEEKLKVISNLEAARTGPTKLFKQISDSIPRDAWLKSFKDQGSVVTLTGFATTDEVVAEFMRRLERNLNVGFVDLEIAQKKVEAETREDVVNFIIKVQK
ncbi:MAG: PilN domain-containing protein [Thermodesulfobacteriota bacterium]|nr:MAG: PilN domain-containing protein [Thermodesulfobacteriota bacterium]